MTLTPEDVRDRLYAALLARRPLITKRRGWLDGSGLGNPVSFLQGERRAFDRFEGLCRDNFLPNVLSAFGDRLRLTGVSTAGAHDEETWSRVRATNLAPDLAQAVGDCLGLGYGYLLVLPHLRRSGVATSRALSPSFAITEAWDDDPREVRYGLNVVQVGEQVEVRLYDDSHMWAWQSPKALDLQAKVTDLSKFVPVAEAAHNLRRVPIIEVAIDGASVVEPGVHHQLRMNQHTLHQLSVERTQAFSIMVVNGIDVRDDEHGEPVAPDIKMAPGRITALELNPDGSKPEIFQSTPSGTTAINSALMQSLVLMAGACSVPPHMLSPQASASVSSDMLRREESRYHSRLQAIASNLEQSIVAAVQTVRVCSGLDERDQLTPHHPLRLPADPVHVGDAVSKMTAAGVPLAQVLVEAGIANLADAQAWADTQDTNALFERLAGSDPDAAELEVTTNTEGE